MKTLDEVSDGLADTLVDDFMGHPDPGIMADAAHDWERRSPLLRASHVIDPDYVATFEENALAKARDAFRVTGLPSVADDSGIEVQALNGMPGVLSARWAGRHGDDEANNELLLGQLADVPADRRGAAFVSACALVSPEGETAVVRGEWRGTIVAEPRGAAGFGYDPLFVPDDDTAGGRTSAELAPEEKDALSHRGKALAQLLPLLRALG